MSWFLHVWPWLGSALLLPLFYGLIFGDLRCDRTKPRHWDFAWLAWAAMAVYLLHQFEEHGIDAQGSVYAFRAALCSTFGFATAATCPIPDSFIAAVNIPLTWFAAPACALLASRDAKYAMGLLGVIAVNAFAHIVPATMERAYNPGLLTAVIFFVPLSIWTISVALRRDLGYRTLFVAISSGVVLHAVLMMSLKVYLSGYMGVLPLLVTQAANACLPIALLTLTRRSRTT